MVVLCWAHEWIIRRSLAPTERASSASSSAKARFTEPPRKTARYPRGTHIYTTRWCFAAGSELVAAPIGCLHIMTHRGRAKAQPSCLPLLLLWHSYCKRNTSPRKTSTNRQRKLPFRTSSRDAGSKTRRTFLPTPFFDLGLPATPRFDLVVFISMLRLLLLPLLLRPPSPPPPPSLRRILPAPGCAERPLGMKQVPAELRPKAFCWCGCGCCRCWRVVEVSPPSTEVVAAAARRLLLKEA